MKRVVQLEFGDLERLGVTRSDYARRDYARTGAMSAVVGRLGCDGLVVPSARYDGRNLVVNLQNLDEDTRVEQVEAVLFRGRTGPS